MENNRARVQSGKIVVSSLLCSGSDNSMMCIVGVNQGCIFGDQKERGDHFDDKRPWHLGSVPRRREITLEPDISKFLQWVLPGILRGCFC